MAGEYTKPLPRPTAVEAPFWEAAKKHELRLQKCLSCGNIWYPPSEGCSKCLSSNYEWSRMSGEGKIWSWVVFPQRYLPSMDTPCNVVSVQMEEGQELGY